MFKIRTNREIRRLLMDIEIEEGRLAVAITEEAFFDGIYKTIAHAEVQRCRESIATKVQLIKILKK